MKLKRLELKAFGPFTDRIINFDADGPGLHIVYGANEAGKSSSLRALKALLYGFRQTTPDNFIHSYDQLLVGGCLENGAGEEIAFYRRKKRKGDIIDKAGNPLDEGILSPFMQGIEPEIFESLYGIDHDALVLGGQDILARKGEVGQALFAAGAGISSLGKIIDKFEKEAADLFKPTGQKPAINMAVKRFKTFKKEVKTASLSIKDWKDHQKTLKAAQMARDDLEKEREYKNRELHRLNRLKQAIPELASLKALQSQKQDLGLVVLLSPDFAEFHQQVTRQIRDVKLQLHKDGGRLAALEKKRDDISFNKEILMHAEKVDDFHQRLGEYRKGQKDRPEKNGMRINLRTEAARLLKLVRPDLGLEEVETLRSIIVKKKTIQTLCSQYDIINQQSTLSTKQLKAAQKDCEKIEKDMAAMAEPKEVEHLIQAVKLAQKAGDIDVQLQKALSRVESDKQNCHRELKRIGLWTGDLIRLTELSLPLPETVQRYENGYSDINAKKRAAVKEHMSLSKDLKNTRVEMKKVAYAGEIPSESDLARARKKREQGWRLLRRRWIEKEDVAEDSRIYNAQLPLAEAYEADVGQADHVSDRLRREADRVAKATALKTRIKDLKEALNDNVKDQVGFDQQVQDLDAAWVGEWENVGITPLSPKEMSGWLTQVEKLRFKIENIMTKEQELEHDTMHRRSLRQALEKELAFLGEAEFPSGETLGPLLMLAERVLKRIVGLKMDAEKLRDRMATSEKAFHQAEEELEVAQKALAQWQTNWEKTICGLNVNNEVTTSEALDLIEMLQSCFGKLREAEDLKKRIDGIDRDATALEEESKLVAEMVSPDLSALPADQIILSLRTQLGQSQKDAMLYDELSKEIDDLKEEIATAEKSLQNSSAQMDELLHIAKCKKPEELPPVIDKYEKYQALLEKISISETTLARIGAGLSIEALSHQTSSVNADELPDLITSFQRDIEERINPEINRISQVIGEENNKLAAMDGSGRAVFAAEKMEQELAGIRRFAERYAVLKLASKILQKEIDRYREEHQDPILKIASKYFGDLTMGSFAGLRTDVDDKGKAMLVGLRPDHLRLTVDQMSSGTRDQLYLALRLATLRWRLETSEAMPFIVDDILINFDDDRSRATLKAFADISQKNQVILFTHHRQIVDMAMRIKAKGVMRIHEL